MHALKYSAVKSPDGLTYDLFGPWEGRHNDYGLLQGSNLLDRCREHALGFYMYGDPAYSICSVLLSPYPYMVEEMTEEEKLFNQHMSSCRESVE